MYFRFSKHPGPPRTPLPYLLLCAFALTASAGCASTSETKDAAADATTNAVEQPAETRWVDVATGEGFGCSLADSGVVYCWGRESDHYPEPLEGDHRFIELASQQESLCGLTEEGKVKCWARYKHASPNLAWTRGLRGPVYTLPTELRFASLHAGPDFTCGIDDQGAAFCWGAIETEQDQGRVAEPLRMPLDEPIVQVVGGHRHMCALTAEGRAYCWGDNKHGQLGDGSTDARSEPTLVATRARFEALASGNTHVCGLTAEGKAHCWGNNEHAQLGDGSTTSQSVPVPVDGLPQVAELALGFDFSCAVTADGEPFCWGARKFAEGGWHRRDAEPDLIEEPEALPTSAELSLGQLDAGPSHVCALSDDEDVYCWGRRGNQLGGRHVRYIFGAGQPDDDQPEPPSVSQALHGDLARCLLTKAGGLGCTGPVRAVTQVFVDQRGDDLTDELAELEPIKGVYDQARFGVRHLCLLTPERELRCMGDNLLGQLGTGSQEMNADTPQPVLDGKAIASFDVADQHSCAITDAGDLYCWGANTRGEVGDDTTEIRRAPVQIGAGQTWNDVVTAARHTCALTDEGRAHCWGDNEYGQLGDGTTESRPKPAPVAGELRFAQLSADGAHTCGRTAKGDVHCWGTNRFLQVSSVPGGPFLEPVAVPLAKPAVEIAASHSFSCARDADGGVWCWGYTSKQPEPLFTNDAKIARLDSANGTICFVDEAGRYGCHTSTMHFGGGSGGSMQTQNFLRCPVKVDFLRTEGTK